MSFDDDFPDKQWILFEPRLVIVTTYNLKILLLVVRVCKTLHFRQCTHKNIKPNQIICQNLGAST